VSLRLRKIVSGGQTGVDRAALDVAIALNLPCGGWCPRGRRAEDGRIPKRYPLEETASPSYASRTIQNVIDSDGTLVLTVGTIRGGTLMTKNAAQKRKKPHLVVDLKQPAEIKAVVDWMKDNEIRVLNVAGPRASQAPEAYDLAVRFLLKLLSTREKPKRRVRSKKA
jgi:hypothetical protein